MKVLSGLFRETLMQWNEDDGITSSAALSFYLILSLPAILLFSVSVGSYLLKARHLESAIIGYIDLVAGETLIYLVEGLLYQIPDIASLTAGAAISFLLLVWAGGNLFRQFKKIIDNMWGFPGPESDWLHHFLKKSFASVIGVFVVGFLLVLNTFVEAFFLMGYGLLNELVPFNLKIIQYASSFSNFLILLVLFIYIYRVLPEARIGMRYVLEGSLFTVLLITIAKYFLAFYLSYGNITTVYGAIGSIIGFLLWVYFSFIAVTFVVEMINVRSKNAKSNKSA
ncbi:YihY/virulence factor BrkB family protein [Methanohalophilus euhalobius]|jgi:membrane protein|nr:YihY/virulence factor BrkB family protein [Methanohalophilus euhalobius]ODV49372.1 MAG: membrane protein [Methanohalophilus sp. 2-GBenrich]RSD35046.1 MAG: membrane protein [Methanohalophilus sp.]PQV43317.1 membrane protein [Methanohalophilus euhalobius]TCL11139.1 membrane protein [Methanohalophilus euhalobius]SNY00257.1 membrane protein [Methanohalophilus euhalobius]